MSSVQHQPEKRWGRQQQQQQRQVTAAEARTNPHKPGQTRTESNAKSVQRRVVSAKKEEEGFYLSMPEINVDEQDDEREQIRSRDGIKSNSLKY
jgi:hypothetical protein